MSSNSMPSVDLSQTHQPSLYASSTIPFAIAFLCVGLRFWCRWKNTAGLWLDDWLILASLVCMVASVSDWEFLILLKRPAGLAWQLRYCGVRLCLIFNTNVGTVEVNRCRDTARSWEAYSNLWTQRHEKSVHRTILLWTDLHRHYCLCQVLHFGLVLAYIQ